MEITDARVTRLAVDLDEPAGISNDRWIDRRGAAIITVETDAGLTGVGEAVGPEGDEVETVVEETFAPRLRGADPLDRERLWSAMLTDGLYADQKGVEVSAASGVDLALWDLAGKYHDEPVYRLLGGDADGTGTVRAYASDLFWDDPDAMAAKAADYVDRGFPAVKTHLGNGVAADRERVRAMNDAIGDAHLMVDVNCGYDRVDARRVGRMLDDHDVYWYEEPVAARDVEGYAELRDELATPLAGGENEFTKWGFRRLFETGAVDYAMPDLMRCGGLTEAKKICALAEAFETEVTPHAFSTGVGLAAALHLLASTPNGEWLEYDTTGYALRDALLAEPIEPTADGTVPLPTAPGLGVELTRKTVAEYGID